MLLAVADMHSCSSAIFTLKCCVHKYMHDVQVQVPSLQTSRFKHCAAASTISPGVTKVVMFGGCPEWPKNPKTGDDFKKLAMTAVLQFGKALHYTSRMRTHRNQCYVILQSCSLSLESGC